MLRGKAIQSTANRATAPQSERGTGRREAGSRDSVTKPTRMRTKVTPLGPIDRSPSAMKRNEAPQMIPGSVR